MNIAKIEFRLKPAYPFLMIWFLLFGCQDDMYIDKYERPEWLAGKVYSQVKEQPELSLFATCLELTGYDTIINISGSYSVFGPSDEAFNTWLAENQYNSVEDVPVEYLEKLVSFHLIQNPWSKSQLRTVDIYGWIDTLDDSNNKPRGFKRETLLTNQERFFPVKSEEEGRYIIVDEPESEFLRKAVSDSRKFAPFFYKEYFDIYELGFDDYEYYFDRSFEGGDELYFTNAKIISNEIKAENGFVYIIDRVVDPLENAYQILENGNGENNYSNFLALLNLFPEFEYNDRKTKEQPGAILGLEVDSLFDLTYPELAFDISNEKTHPPSGTFGLPENVTIRYHHGMLAPTNEAFDQLINDYINVPGGWGSLERSPLNIKRIIANAHMSVNAVYLSDLSRGFYNGENDLVELNADDVVQKEFGSNCTFMGLGNPIVPNAFNSVTGPVYLQPGFSRCMYAIEQSGLLPALKRRNKNYILYAESDFNLKEDSSLLYNQIEEEFYLFSIQPFGRVIKYGLNKNNLRTLLLNHVAVDLPKGIARKEFVPNLAGNYLCFNNETGEVSGTDVTTVGYKGLEIAQNFPQKISQGTINGDTYEIENWFSFKASDLYTTIQSSYPTFYDLMKRAGLVLAGEYRFTFISNNEFYTVFIPTNEALAAADVSSLSNKELKELILLHFIQGHIMFTDGNKDPGYYETMRTKPSSNEFISDFTKIYIEPAPDIIHFKAKDGSDYATILESERTNSLTGIIVESDETSPVYPNVFNNAVIHEIDQVLLINELDAD
jgi:uncharacterized surface protein with fasciclin (FAS1) repeats